MPSHSAQSGKRPVLIGLALVAAILFSVSIMKPAVEEWYLAGFMHRAIRGGDVDEVESLLKQGANPNRVGAGALKGGTPLTWALEYGSDLEIIQVLIKGGADLNRNIAHGYTALMCAETPEAAQLLLNSGADPTIQNDNGDNAWHTAKINQQPRVADLIERAQTKWRAKRSAGDVAH